MTNSPNSGHEPEPRSNTRQRRVLQLGCATGLVLLAGGGAGAWWAWRFVHNELAPLVAQNLSDLFNRPVEVGDVENIGFTSLTIGESVVPATETDPDRFTVPEIRVQFNPLEVLWDRTLSLDVTLLNPEGYIEQDEDGLWISTKIKEQEQKEQLVKIELDTLRVEDGTMRLAPFIAPEEKSDIPSTTEIVPESDVEADDRQETTASETPTPTPVIEIRSVDAVATFREDNKLIGYTVTGNPETGGNFRLQGETDLRISQTRLQVEGRELLAADIGLLVPLPIKLQAGTLSADLGVVLPETTEDLTLSGTVRFRDAVARLPQAPKPFTNGNGALRFNGQTIAFQDVQARYGAVNARVAGGLNLDTGYAIDVVAPSVTVANLLETFDVEADTLPIELTGEFRGDLKVGGAIDQPVITGVATNTEPLQVDRVTFEQASTQFTFTPEAVRFNQIQAVPTGGGLISGTGEIVLGDQGGFVFDVTGNDLPGDTIAAAYGASQANFVVGAVDAEAQVFGSLDDFSNVRTLVEWQAPEATYPGRGEVAIIGSNIRFEDTVLLVAGGMVQGEGEVANGLWRANLVGSGIELSQFSPDLRGSFGGNFRLSGSLDNFSLAAIQAEGEASFSEGIAIITDPLRASVRWLGDRVEILEATARGFDAAGTIGVLLEGAGAPGISNLDLDVRLRDYAITNLPIPTPETIALAGTADFNGRVTGTPAAPRAVGNLGLNDFAVNEIVFEPRLTGEFQYLGNQGLNLDVAGGRDRITVALDGQNRPESFYVQWRDSIAEGRSQGDRLLATLQNFPLQALNLAPAGQLGLGEVGGNLSGQFDINLAELTNPTVFGEFVVVQPSIDYIAADSFTGRFRYFDGVGILDEGELRRGGSLYQLAGSFNPGADPQFQGKITAAPGRVEDIFAALQWFELVDLGRGVAPPSYAGAEDVQTIAVGNPNATILNQLRRYSEILALQSLQIAQREESSFLPDLSTLTGSFSGDIALAYSPTTGPDVEFALNGRDWQWGEYQVNQVIAQGGFESGILTLRPVLLQSDDSLLRFTGRVGGEEQSGQLIAQNIPLKGLRDLFRLPLDVESGVLNANAFLTGSLGNPQVLGEVQLENATINQVDAPPFQALFGYSDARLEIESRVVGDEENTFRFTGSIPYRFPFMTARPESNEFNLNLNIRNDGLALASLFTDQVAWKGGEGDVQLRVNGSLDTSDDEPQLSIASAVGQATFNNASFAAKALPEDITNVSGNILFNNDRIQVEMLQGQFSDGELVAQGTLPLLIPLDRQNPQEAAPLVLSFDNVDLELAELYEGAVNGQVLLLGTALSPILTGAITLSDGSIFIPESAAPSAAPPEATAPSALPGLVNPPEFQDLRLVLGERLRVVREPILNFLVAGELLINGTQDDLRPDGTIRVRAGQVNLFATQFYLSDDQENVAIFTPSRGLDPVLQVQLVTSVTEVTRAPVARTSPLTTSEIAETPAFEYGAFQTIRVEATVNGPASQIYNNLELSSSPSRSEAEIIALIGGGFLDTLGQGDATTAIANIAGATILNNVQNFITDATGLTDFRLFPTNVPSDEERSSTLALGGELGIDITDNLSVSVLQILTTEAPTRFGLRYRLNDQFTLRGSTDTEGNSQAVLEFFTRF